MRMPISHPPKSQRLRPRAAHRRALTLLIVLFTGILLLGAATAGAAKGAPCLPRASVADALLVVDPEGRIVHARHDREPYVPASTLKIRTALAAFHYLGPSYAFPTEFYLDAQRNLKVKGYGDPLLISEVLKEIGRTLAPQVKSFNDLVLDDSFFASQIKIPGRSSSTNPYDAPVGALCANFNTIFFRRTKKGRILSAEPQTPMTPFARERAASLGLRRGRYTFTHDRREAARYAGELLMHFLREEGAKSSGSLRLGAVAAGDRWIHTHLSPFTLEQAVEKMMESSNNFMANQIFISLGVRAFGPPGTLEKGVRAVSAYLETELHLKGARIVEGSGISRKNRITPRHMMTILEHFQPYLRLLRKKGMVYYKTGSLRDIRTLAGYVQGVDKGPSRFVIFLKRDNIGFSSLIKCVGRRFGP